MAAATLRAFAVAFLGRFARGGIHLARPDTLAFTPALRTWYRLIVSLDEFLEPEPALFAPIR